MEQDDNLIDQFSSFSMQPEAPVGGDNSSRTFTNTTAHSELNSVTTPSAASLPSHEMQFGRVSSVLPIRPSLTPPPSRKLQQIWPDLTDCGAKKLPQSIPVVKQLAVRHKLSMLEPQTEKLVVLEITYPSELPKRADWRNIPLTKNHAETLSSSTTKAPCPGRTPSPSCRRQLKSVVEDITYSSDLPKCVDRKNESTCTEKTMSSTAGQDENMVTAIGKVATVPLVIATPFVNSYKPKVGDKVIVLTPPNSKLTATVTGIDHKHHPPRIKIATNTGQSTYRAAQNLRLLDPRTCPASQNEQPVGQMQTTHQPS